jgi:hypothetical protein
MGMTGGGTSSAIVPKEEQAGVDMIPHGGNPAEGRDLGAAENMIDTVRAGKAQVARNDPAALGLLFLRLAAHRLLLYLQKNNITLV